MPSLAAVRKAAAVNVCRISRWRIVLIMLSGPRHESQVLSAGTCDKNAGDRLGPWSLAETSVPTGAGRDLLHARVVVALTRIRALILIRSGA